MFVENIQNDIEWLGFSWDELHFASDFFEKLYEIACGLIRKGVAYVDDQTSEEMRKNRGTLTKPGVNSPYRDRSVEENLDLFRRMRDGEFPDGSRVLRAKIDMASPNVLMRDPTLYRILRCHHHRTGDNWCIYPMYDFQHPLQDAIEGITHSLCSLEYEIHRPLYDWVVREAGFEHPPRQIEFARLNLTRTVMSKRHLRRFVEEGVVAGWDDPRMPTLAAMRRRGYSAAAVKDFLGRVGRGQGRFHGGPGPAGALRARRPGRPRSARHGRAASPESHALQLAGGLRGRDRHGEPSRPPRDGASARCTWATSSTSTARTSWKTRPRSSSASLPAAKCASKGPTSSAARKSSTTQTAKSPSSSAPWTWTAAPAARAPTARSRARCTG